MAEEAKNNPEETRLRDRFVIMHIPKCAGTTLRKMLEARHGSASLVQLYSRKDQFGKPYKALKEYTQSFVIGHVGVDYLLDKEHGRKLVTFMRDPVERVLSHYYYWRSISENSMGPKLAACLSLKDFLSSDVVAVRRQISNLQAWMFISNIDMMSRHRAACCSIDELFEKALENTRIFDFIGFTENFDKDLAHLNVKYNWGLSSEVDILNKSPDRKSAAELDEETMDLVRGVTRLDRRLYQYVKKQIYPYQFATGVPEGDTQFIGN